MLNIHHTRLDAGQAPTPQLKRLSRSMPNRIMTMRLPSYLPPPRSSALPLMRLFTLLFLSTTLSAEIVHMQNGDMLSGEITAKTKNTLSLKTHYAGTIQISRAQIKKINDSRATAQITSTKTAAKPKVTLPMSELNPTLVAPASSKNDRDKADGKFVGNIHLALKSEKGNNDQDEIDFNFYLHYSKGDHRYHVYGQIEYDLRDNETTKQDWQIYPTYDYFFSEKLYGSLAYSAKQEKFAGLDLRQSMGPSIGYQFYEGEPVSLKSSLGLYFVNENYTNKDDAQYLGPGWNLEYKHDLFGGKMQFYHRHYSSLSVEEFEKFLWHSWTGVKLPVVSGIVISLEYEVDYDGQPALQADTLDTTLRFKLGYEW